MNKYKYKIQITSIILIFVFSSALMAQDDDIIPFGADSVYQEYYLGFNLNSNMNGGLVNFALVKPLPNGKTKIILLTKDDFVYQAKGKMKSPGNPHKIDFFKNHQIENLAVLDNLWKLRYREYPFYTREKMPMGWSENDTIPFLPTEAQMEILRGFGINRFTDYIYGEAAFRLLSSMEDPQWVKAYKESY